MTGFRTTDISKGMYMIMIMIAEARRFCNVIIARYHRDDGMMEFALRAFIVWIRINWSSVFVLVFIFKSAHTSPFFVLFYFYFFCPFKFVGRGKE